MEHRRERVRCLLQELGRRQTATEGFQAMPNQICTRAPTAQAQMRQTAVNSRPITGQPVSAAASQGVAIAGMTHSQGAALMTQTGGRPTGYQTAPRQMPGQHGGLIPQTQQSVVIPGQDPLTAIMLAAAPPQEQKQMLGERLFPLIQRMYPELAGKITGMLLEIDNSELLHMLESHESLELKVEEAVAVLQAHQVKSSRQLPRKINNLVHGHRTEPQQSVVIPGQDPLTAIMLAAAPPQEQKQMLGERLFPLIQRMYPELAGKITGMLLEIDNSELLHMLESHESLELKVEEAVAVLQAHQVKSSRQLPRKINNLVHGHRTETQQSVVIPGQDPLTAIMLAAAPPQEQKQMLGERLFPLIQRMYPELAGKITGMLLEIDNSELLHMLESHESLELKVEEAVAVLQAHQAKQQAAAKKDLTILFMDTEQRSIPTC